MVALMSEVFDWSGFLPAFRAAARSAGFAEEELIPTADGPVSVWTRARPAAKRIYLSAGIHGDEPAGPLALLDLMRSGFFGDSFEWILCPALNPGGLARNQRENADGMDLNRDYWKCESPEVRAHVAWLDAADPPDCFLSLHEDWESAGFYLYEINLGEDQPHRAQAILEAVRPWFAPEPGMIDGHHTRTPGWIYHEAEADVPEGWPEAIYLAKRQCPLSFTFETPSRAALAQRVAALRAAVTTAMAAL